MQNSSLENNNNSNLNVIVFIIIDLFSIKPFYFFFGCVVSLFTN